MDKDGRIRTKWYEYCPNCSNRVKLLKTGDPTETLANCTNCPYQEVLDITKQNRPE